MARYEAAGRRKVTISVAKDCEEQSAAKWGDSGGGEVRSHRSGVNVMTDNGNHGSSDSHGHGGHGEAAAGIIPEKSIQDFGLVAIAGICLCMLVYFGFQLGSSTPLAPATEHSETSVPAG